MYLIRYLDMFCNWQMIFCSDLSDLIKATHAIDLDLCELEIYSLNFLGESWFVIMKKRESIDLVKYLYFMESRLLQGVEDCSYRYVRRELDSVDLLEEIIAKERLKFFYEIENSIIKILHMYYEGD